MDAQRGSQLSNAEIASPNYDRWIDACVPGEIHLDLWRLGLIDDPYVGTNVLKARWVEEFYWTYRLDFDLPPDALNGRCWLHFDGLDLAASIRFNGEEIGRHANSFTPCRFEVTGKAAIGKNTLIVHIESGLHDVADKPTTPYSANLDHRLTKPQWLRKPQSSFGWDWAPRLLNVGITGSVCVEWTDAPARVDRLVPLAEASDDLQRGWVRVRQFIEGFEPETKSGLLRVRVGEAVATNRIDIKPGLHPYEIRIEIDHPELWWPVGHGAQPLYEVVAELEVDGAQLGTTQARIGFRNIKVLQDPHPKGGRYFVIEVNGKKIFAKGGNFVPADMIFSRIDSERYDKLTDLALESNFNMLRVWGGGLYEADSFYDMCDEKGILVWQEFIFACKKYPMTDEAFHENVKAEAVYHIRRLASHASLAIWCGNNEMEWGNWDWGFDKGIVYPDYSFFHLTIPRLLDQEDPTRYYQASSPFSPGVVNPNANNVGDQHPWSVGFANTDFRDYRKMDCRFPNEGGILGPTSLPTMLACLPEGQRRIHSFAWMTHDNSIASYGDPSGADSIIRQWVGKDDTKLDIEEFAYWAGLVQGEGLREYCDNFRRRMFDSASAVFWMYNDTWPATRSWTTVDYYLRRTPAFHPVRRAFQPVSVVVAEDGDDVVVFGINDGSHPISGELRYGIFNTRGGYPLDVTAHVELAANASTRIAAFPRRDWRQCDPAATKTGAFAILSRDGQLISRNRLFLPFLKDLALEKANVRVRLEGEKAIFDSSAFVLGVCLDLNGEERLPDNFFDLYPEMPYELPWCGTSPPKILYAGNMCSQELPTVR